MKKVIKTAITAAACVCLASPALAHPGHAEHLSLTTGFIHPLLGIDHVLAMLGVGLYAAQLGGRAFWMLPAAFLTAMIGGCVIGYEGVAFPMVEQTVALSVIIMGVVIAFGIKMPISLGITLVAAFAVFHGHAHGSEGAEIAAFLPYVIGFAVATGALHATGMALGLGLDEIEKSNTHFLRRSAGATNILVGVVLLSSANI